MSANKTGFGSMMLGYARFESMMRNDRHPWPDGMPSPVHAALAAMLVATVYAASHPYWGIAHDARLYLGQAIQRTGIADLSTDPFFAYGSQDRFTFYTRPLGELISLLGLSWAALLSTVLGVSAMLVATFGMVRRLAGTQAALAATLFVAALPGRYSALGLLLVEPYATPRAWASACVLFGMWAVLERRRAASLAAFVLALLFHPLIALPGIAWVALVVGRPRWLIALGMGGALIVAGAAIFDVSPFDQLLVRIDGEWRRLLEDQSPYLYLLLWEHREWSGHSGTSTMVVLAVPLLAVRMSDATRRVFLAGGAVAAGGALASLVGGDVLQIALVVQVQPWRALWIASFLTLVGAGILLVRVTGRWSVEDAVVLCAVAAGLMLQSWASPIPVIVAGLLLLSLARTPGTTTARWSLIAAIAVLVESFVWCVLERANVAMARELSPDSTSLWPISLRDPFLWLAIGLTVAWATFGLRARLLHVAFSVLIAMGFGLAIWDWIHAMRNDNARIGRHANVAALAAMIPESGAVYWNGDLVTPWFEMGRPSYTSITQMGGIVFHRSTAIEFSRRADLVASATKGYSNANAQLLRRMHSPVDRDGARILCRDPILTAVYLENLHDGAIGPSVLDQRGRRQGTLALCERLRDG